MPDRVPTLRIHARRLRREQTDAERKLWARLRARQVNGAKFRRQHPIGRYIADFCCPELRVVVELDGGQHAVQVDADRRRAAFLEQRGCRVLRFWDNEVLENIEAVLERIAQILRDPHPIPLSTPLSPLTLPLPGGERRRGGGDRRGGRERRPPR